jgi:hypothetical protein
MGRGFSAAQKLKVRLRWLHIPSKQKGQTLENGFAPI